MTDFSTASEPLGIVELVGVCETQQAWHEAWSIDLGSAVADLPSGRLQRWAAGAARRHAELARRWAERRPAIPAGDTGTQERRGAHGADLIEHWLADTSRVANVLSALRGRVDPDLDPATIAVIDECERSLRELADSRRH